MSRIGKQPIIVPSAVELTITDLIVTAKGPRGILEVKRQPGVKVERVEDKVILSIPEKKVNDTTANAYFGLMRTLINNIVVGVTDGFKKDLEMKGIGYKAQLQGEDLVLNVGFSHPVVIKKIEGIKFAVAENVNITIEGNDKVQVGQVAANIRKIRQPEPYKGKGIKYKDEIIRRKSSKGGKGAKK